MSPLAFKPRLRACLITAALGATALVTTQPAEAHHFHGLGLSIGIGGGYSGPYVGPRCGYLYRKAVRTGDPYWWDRYEACRYGY